MTSKEFDKDNEAELATPEEAISNNSNDPTQPQEKNDQLHRTTSIAPPPDGGYGWVCTACCATINAHTWGMSWENNLQEHY